MKWKRHTIAFLSKLFLTFSCFLSILNQDSSAVIYIECNQAVKGSDNYLNNKNNLTANVLLHAWGNTDIYLFIF